MVCIKSIDEYKNIYTTTYNLQFTTVKHVQDNEI